MKRGKLFAKGNVRTSYIDKSSILTTASQYSAMCEMDQVDHVDNGVFVFVKWLIIAKREHCALLFYLLFKLHFYPCATSCISCLYAQKLMCKRKTNPHKEENFMRF